MRTLIAADPASQPVRNLTQHPASTGWVGIGVGVGNGANVINTNVAAGGDGPGGRAYKRLTIKANLTPGTSADCVSFNPTNYGVSTFGMTCLTTLGQAYTITVPVRSSVAQGLRLQAQGITPTGGGVTLNGSDVVLTPNVWTRLVVRNWVPSGSTLGVRADVDTASVAGNLITWPAGATLDVGRPSVYLGSTEPVCDMDGSVPGWVWTGVAESSESVGYPYTLESITGPAAGVVTSTAQVTATPPGAFSARTIYVVDDIFDQADNYSTTLYAGDPSISNGRLALQTGPSGSTTRTTRVDTLNGQVNAGMGFVNRRTVGRHVGMIQVNQGITTARATYDDGVLQSQSVTPGDGMAGSVLKGGQALPSVNIVAGYEFFADHDNETVKRVMAWLGRCYYGPVPSGY